MVGLNLARNNIPRVRRVPFGTIAVELRHARPRRCPVRSQTMLTVLMQTPAFLSGNWDESYWKRVIANCTPSGLIEATLARQPCLVCHLAEYTDRAHELSCHC